MKKKFVIICIITNLRNVCLAGSESLLATHFFVKCLHLNFYISSSFQHISVEIFIFAKFHHF